MTNSFKLQFLFSKYNTEKILKGDKEIPKSVTCELVCTMMLPIPFTQSMINKYKDVKFRIIPMENSNIIPSIAKIVVTGTSMCHNEDKFDFSVGKHLSESRAKIKAYDLAKRILTDLINEYTVDKQKKVKKMSDYSDNGIYFSPITIAKKNIAKLAKFTSDEIEHVNAIK